jgi:hypothetical protein
MDTGIVKLKEAIKVRNSSSVAAAPAATMMSESGACDACDVTIV